MRRILCLVLVVVASLAEGFVPFDLGQNANTNLNLNSNSLPSPPASPTAPAGPMVLGIPSTNGMVSPTTIAGIGSLPNWATPMSAFGLSAPGMGLPPTTGTGLPSSYAGYYARCY